MGWRWMEGVTVRDSYVQNGCAPGIGTVWFFGWMMVDDISHRTGILRNSASEYRIQHLNNSLYNNFKHGAKTKNCEQSPWHSEKEPTLWQAAAVGLIGLART